MPLFVLKDCYLWRRMSAAQGYCLLSVPLEKGTDLFIFRSMSVFLLVKANEKGQIGKPRVKRRLGHVVFAALKLASCVCQTNIVAVINWRYPHIFPKQPTEIWLAHVA